MDSVSPLEEPAQLKLWDFGWLDFRDIQIPKCETSSEVLTAYLGSESFGATFARPDPDVCPELHGSFERSNVLTSDFRLLTRSEFVKEMDSIRNHPDFGSPPTNEQWQPVEELMLRLNAANSWTVALLLNESDRSKHHEWGFVLHLFREFLFASPRTGKLSRAVFGYD